MKQIIMTDFTIDTNILIYSHDNTATFKQDIARDLIVEQPVVSNQVVSEYINVLQRIVGIKKEQIFEMCLPNLKHCNITMIDIKTLQLAEKIMKRYDFQIFDAIIVAAALETGCKILYSEDMHNELFIEKQLKIINPFL